MAVVVIALAAENHWVKWLHENSAQAQFAQQPSARAASMSGVLVSGVVASAVLVLAIIAWAVPIPLSQAQPTGEQLPDLISDPPEPAFLKELVTEDGTGRLVITFDGYIHNIGDGPLDVVGNPQLVDGMVQRVSDGELWHDIATPTVRFENDDGHNHFHLVNAIDYVLWDEHQGSQAADGSKVGFCLVDSEQMEAGTEQAYSEELDNFCQENNPGATSLRMGISPGWRDIYDRTTTLQWVDISSTVPGRYWIGAVTDPNNEIVESDEENNGLIFSNRPAIVPGWKPFDASATSNGDPAQITLSAEAFGTVSAPVYQVEQGPTSGQLNVPVGAAVSDPVLTYTPDAGFTGQDTIVFSVRDSFSQYPLSSPTATVTIEIDSAGDGAAAGDGVPESGLAPGLIPESTFFEMQVGERFETAMNISSVIDDSPTLFGIGLPPGMIIDGHSIVGVAAVPGFFNAEMVVIDDFGATATQEITVIVTPAESAGLADTADRSSPLMAPVQIQFGPPSLGTTFTAVGLPPGLEIDPAAPVVFGTPTQVGTYSVTLSQTDPDRTQRSTSFEWTVRPAIAISFAL